MPMSVLRKNKVENQARAKVPKSLINRTQNIPRPLICYRKLKFDL